MVFVATPVGVRVPDPSRAPNYRSAVALDAGFEVVDCGDNVLLLAPPPGERRPCPYFTAHRLGDASTDWSAAETWEPVRLHPPHGRRDWSAADRRRSWATVEQLKRREHDQAADLAALALSVLALSNDGELIEDLSDHASGLFESFPKGSLWWISASSLLVKRHIAAQVHLAMELTPEINLIAEGGSDHLSALDDLALTKGVDFSDIHAPALLAFSPGLTGFVMPCAPHALVLMFGELQDMRRPWPHWVPTLLEPRVLMELRDLNDEALLASFAPEDAEDLLTWWTDRLNILYTHGLDPTNFASLGTSGMLDAGRQTAFLVTLERLLTDLLLIVGQPQAPNIFRVQTAFDLLDKAETLLGFSKSGTGFEALLRRTTASTRLQDALAPIPGVGPRLADRSTRVFDALYEQVLADVLPSRRRGRGVLVAQKTPENLVNTSSDVFVGKLIRHVRNSAHGLHAMLGDSRRFTLSVHTGGIPGELADLAALVGFALVADAERLVDGTWSRELQ